jgi:AraC-like DNA-binding protein
MQVSFSVDEVAAHQRERLFREAASKWAIGVTPAAASGPGSFSGRVSAQIAGPFALAQAEAATNVVRRTRADVARDTAIKFRLVRAPVETLQTVALTHARSEELRVGAGDMVISSSEWTFVSTVDAGPTSAEMLVIPQERLAPLLAGGHLTRPLLVRAASPLGALLGAGLSAAFTQLPRLSPELGEAVLQNFCGMMALALGAGEDGQPTARQSLREMRLAAAKRHVDAHLSDPALTPASVAGALGISVRQLHLLFQPTAESFGQYVTRRRLEACRAALTSPVGARRSVLDIAYGWGFDNLSTFYSAFSRTFGVTPGDVRAAARRGGN